MISLRHTQLRRMRAHPRQRNGELARRDENGAVLLLALIFMVVTALIVTGLAAWSGNDIKNIGNIKSGRSALYAADGAVQTAIWNVRYAYPPGISNGTSTTPWTGFCPSFTGAGTNPMSLDGWSIDVTCSMVVNEGSSPNSRTVTLSAYPAYPSRCNGSGCNGNPLVTAQVQFNDFSSLLANSCPVDNAATWTYEPTTSCGTGEVVVSWVVQPGLT
jgi:hypothetical protein